MNLLDTVQTTTIDLRESQDYKDWVLDDLAYVDSDGNGAELVLEREIDKPINGYPSTLISIVKRDGTYRIYRTFGLGDGAVSVDYSDITAEKVFELLLDQYSQKRN